MAMALTTPSQKLMQEIYDQFLICKICYETYTTPKTLSCLHIFCADCLDKHMNAEVERTYRYMLYSRYISCPICRKKTELPSGGIRRLPDNFLVSNLTDIVSRRRGFGKSSMCEICKPMGYKSNKDAVSKCLECNKMLCTTCVDLHKRTKVTRNHCLIDTAVEKSIGCKVHAEEIVRFYCEPCEMCICILCTFQEHKGHNVQSFTEGMEKYEHSLDALVGKCQERIIYVREHLDKIHQCEAGIRRAEDEIRDTAIESISAIRKSERQMVEALYEVYGEDTFEFLKEKHVLQEILDNLMNTSSLTEIILKDKSIELLLLRREIQDKLEVLLQNHVRDPPSRILRQVTFNPGNIVFGHLAIDGDKEIRGEKSVVKVWRKICDADVQTDGELSPQERPTMDKSIYDYDYDNCTKPGVRVSSIGTDMLGYGPETDSVSSNTCPLDTQDSHTMTDSVSVVKRKIQTDSATTADRGIETIDPGLWEKFTNTPKINQVDRSTLTTKQNITDSHTDTKGLIHMMSTSSGHDIVMAHTGTLTENIHQINKAVNTVGPEIADKITSTPKITKHEKCLGTATVTTLDMGIMARFLGVDKGVATRPIVLLDSSVGENNVKTSDRGTDTAWKCVRRVRDKYTMHDLLYCTKETDTTSLVTTSDRACSPCHMEVAAADLLLTTPKRKITTETPLTKRVCTGEEPSMNRPKLHTKSSQTDMVLTELPKRSDVPYPLPYSRVLRRQPSTEDKGVATPFLYTLTKETSTTPTKTREKSTATYVQTLEKATYMIQPIILSTGTNTPLLLTSDKKVDTELETRDSWTTPVTVKSCDGHTSMETPYTTTVSTDTNGILTLKDTGSDSSSVDNTSVATMTPMCKVHDRTTETARVPIMDAATSMPVSLTERLTDTLDITEKVAHPEASDTGILKRPHGLSRSTSIKKIKTVESAMLTDHATPTVNKESSPYRTRTVDRYTSPMRVILQNKNVNVNIKTPTSEKTTSTFKIELKNCGVGTPIVRFIDRESSPVKCLEPEKITRDRSTSVARVIKLNKQTGTLATPVKHAATLTKRVQYVDRESTPVRVPMKTQGTLASVATSSKEVSTPMVVTSDHATSMTPVITTDSGIGMSSVTYYEKETCTPHVNLMHKNVATENMSTADKQTSTVDVTAAYRDLIAPGRVPVTLSRGTCTVQLDITHRETSPIKELRNTTERATSPIRKRYVDKGISVTQADLMCPVDKFQRPGQGKQRVLSKITTKDDEAVTFVPMATIQETSSDEESTCAVAHSMKVATKSGGKNVVHKERLWLTGPRFASSNSKLSKTPVQTASITTQASTFSANGSSQTSSILCKVETGTSTPPIETEDKAMCTESFSVDSKITECISKLRTVSQRLEAQTTSFLPDESSLTGPIYSKADTCKREPVITQARTGPVLSRQVSATQQRKVEPEGIAPLPTILKRPRRLGGKPGDNEGTYPFLARRELHSIDTGMVSSDAANSFRSKARKQRLDITQLLHRPPGSSQILPPPNLQGSLNRTGQPGVRFGQLESKSIGRRSTEVDGEAAPGKLRSERPHMGHLLTSMEEDSAGEILNENRVRANPEREAQVESGQLPQQDNKNKAQAESRLARSFRADKQTAAVAAVPSVATSRHSRTEVPKDRKDRLKKLRQTGFSRSESTESTSSPESPSRRKFERDRRFKDRQ